jgi:hypothetical protein
VFADMLSSAIGATGGGFRPASEESSIYFFGTGIAIEGGAIAVTGKRQSRWQHVVR